MADADNTPANLLFLAAATPALAATGDPAWDSAFATYLRLDALQRADADFGDYAQAIECDDKYMAQLEAEHGHAFRTLPELQDKIQQRWSAFGESETRREEDYLAPYWHAGRELARTPAPNLAAALFKIEIIKREELHLDCNMFPDPIELVAEDMNILDGGLAIAAR